MKVEKERAYAQVAATALKSSKLPAGTELTISDYVQKDTKGNNGKMIANDHFVCVSAGKRINISARELFKMSTENGALPFKSEGADVVVADKIKILSSVDREDRNGNKVYPTFSYKLAQEFLDGKVEGWDNLVAGGLVEDNKFGPVQNYSIAVL